jgi:hypothetical protein
LSSDTALKSENDASRILAGASPAEEWTCKFAGADGAWRRARIIVRIAEINLFSIDAIAWLCHFAVGLV